MNIFINRRFSKNPFKYIFKSCRGRISFLRRRIKIVALEKTFLNKIEHQWFQKWWQMRREKTFLSEIILARNKIKLAQFSFGCRKLFFFTQNSRKNALHQKLSIISISMRKKERWSYFLETRMKVRHATEWSLELFLCVVRGLILP